MPISLGGKRQTTSTTSSLDKNVTTSSQQNQTGLQSQRQSSSGITSGQTQSQGTSSTDNVQQSTTQQQQRQAQTQTGQLLRDTVLNPLEQAVTGLLARAGGTGMAPGIRSELESFDVGGFVESIMTQARSRTESQRQEQIALAENAVGGSQSNNSAAALLANRINASANESLAAQEAQALAQGNAILRENSDAILRGAANENQLLASLLDSLRGAVTTATATGTTESTAAQQARNLGTTRTSEAGSQQQTQNNQSNTDVLSQLMTLLQGTEATRANEQSRSRTSSVGIGIGF